MFIFLAVKLTGKQHNVTARFNILELESLLKLIFCRLAGY
ncbi:Uncharacterised protein [Bartonella grahamii]|uniref:Uncharacterized protein n=1 Tax=Bartonella grahamii TaxID=33045 RepID=A0A336NEJ0_BARGR|nr:Uncharacterised protein [Bartonella grahamii]